jgi:predicted nuclease of predicted toxin-antitoxin system
VRVKVDEDLPQAVVDLLRRAAHDAVGVLDQEMGGWKDPVLWNAVQAEDRFLITADKGLADIRAHPPGSHHGILLLRPATEGIDAFVALLDQVLRAVDLDQLAGTVAVADPGGLRVRRSA